MGRALLAAGLMVGALVSVSSPSFAETRSVRSAETSYPITMRDAGSITSDYSGDGITYQLKFQWDESRHATITLSGDAPPKIVQEPQQLTASGSATSTGKPALGDPDDACSYAAAGSPPDLIGVQSVNATGTTRTVSINAALPIQTGANSGNGQPPLTHSGLCTLDSIDGPDAYLFHHPSSLNHVSGEDSSIIAKTAALENLDLDELTRMPKELSFPLDYTETDAFGGSEHVVVDEAVTISADTDTCPTSGSGAARAAASGVPEQHAVLASARSVDRSVPTKGAKKCSMRVWALAWGNGSTPAIWDQDKSEGGEDVLLKSYQPKLPSDCSPAPGSEWIACSTPSKTQLNWPVSVARGPS